MKWETNQESFFIALAGRYKRHWGFKKFITLQLFFFSLSFLNIVYFSIDKEIASCTKKYVNISRREKDKQKKVGRKKDWKREEKHHKRPHLCLPRVAQAESLATTRNFSRTKKASAKRFVIISDENPLHCVLEQTATEKQSANHFCSLVTSPWGGSFYFRAAFFYPHLSSLLLWKRQNSSHTPHPRIT